MTTLTKYAQKRIVGTIKEKLMNGYSFTSLDIANELKDDGVRLRNREVAEMLRSMVLPIAHKYHCLYNITLIRVDSKADGPTWAYVYHHKNADPDSYMARDQNPKSVRQALEDEGITSDLIDIQRKARKRAEQMKAAARAVLLSTVTTTEDDTQPHWKSQKRDSNGRFC